MGFDEGTQTQAADPGKLEMHVLFVVLSVHEPAVALLYFAVEPEYDVFEQIAAAVIDEPPVKNAYHAGALPGLPPDRSAHPEPVVNLHAAVEGPAGMYRLRQTSQFGVPE